MAYLDFAVQERPLFQVVFGAGLDKSAHPPLAEASAAVLAVLLPPAAAVRPTAPEELLVTVAALAHGTRCSCWTGRWARSMRPSRRYDDGWPPTRRC